MPAMMRVASAPHLEASADVEDAVHRLDVAQEGVAEALARRRTPACSSCYMSRRQVTNC